MRGGNVEPDQGTCAVCGAAVALTSVLTCPACGSDYGTPAGTAVRQADAALQSIAASEQGLARLREQWLTYRSEQVEHLRRTAPPAQPHRPAPLETFAPPPAYVPPDEEQGLADIPPPAGEPVVAAPAPEPAPSEAAYAGPPAPEPVAAESAEPEPQAAEAAVPPAPASGKRKKSKAAAALTAPALLGVAGASLLIAAAVVFVAIAWTVFSPLARGAVVALVAVAVAGLAVWMRRLGLLVSSGAVGTVAVGFAGAAAIAVARDLPAVGAFDVTLALLVACGAGLALARLRIPWVGSVSALALAGATVTFTVAAVRTSEGAGGTATGSSAWVWSLAGTAAALALASTHRFWRWNVARGAIRWGAVGWLTIVAGASVAWLWWGDGTTPDAIAALAPVAALAVVARTWPLLALGPLAFTLTLVAPAAAATLGADWWEQATVVAVVVAALLAVGSRLQGAGRWAFLAGLAPAYLVVAIASGVYSVSLTVARLLAGTYVPDTNLWAGVAALIAGLSVAQLRQWRMDSRWLDAATIAGAVMVITGTGIVAFGLAELTGPPWYHSSVAVATAAAGAGLLAALRLWWDPRARWVTAAGSLVFVLVSAYYAAWALLMGQAALLMALVIVALPAVVLVARGAVSPWWGWLAAVVVLSADAGALAARYETPLAVQFAAAVAVAAAVVWLARGRYLHSAVLAGTAPAMVLAAASVVWSLDVMVPDGLREGPSPSTWWHAATLLAAVAAAGARRWRVLDGARAHIESAGVVTLAAAALGGAVAAARAWLPDALIVAMVLAAIAVAASTRVWTTERARAAVSATAMVVAALAGLRSLPWLADADQNLVWALVGLAAALAVLAGLAVWRRPAALTAASVLTTLALLAVTMRAEWASGSSMVAVSALVAAIAWAALLVPARLRAAQWWGLAPAVAVMAVVTAGGAVAGALDVLVDWGLASNWWLLAIAASLVVTVVAFRGESRVRQVYPWALTFAYVALVGTLAAAVAPHRVGTSAWVIAVLAIGVAAALGVAAAGARWLWPARATWPRAAMRYGSMAWTVIAALGSLIALGRHELGLAAAAAIVLVTAGALAVASMRWRWALSGAVVLVTAVAPALALYGERGLAVLAAVVAAGAWALHAVPARLVRPGVVGLVPGAIVTAAWSLAGISQVVTAVFLDADHARSPWLPVVAGLASVALAAVPQLRPHLLTIVGLGAAVAATALPWWLAPLVIAVLSLGLVTYRAGRAGTVPTAMSSTALRAVPPAVAVGIALWAIVYAWSDMWPVAITAAAASAVSVIAARRVLWPAVIAVATAALAGGAAISAAGLDAVAPVAVALGMARALELEWRRIVPAGAAMPVTAGAVVVVATVGAGSGTGAGGALVAAGVGWLGFVAMGRKGSRWVSASLLSLGTALILADAGVRFIEAYMAVPAAAAIIIGVAWMRRSPEVSSLAALGPGLALALVPSYIALALAPDHVLRTAWLVVAIVILAALGVRLRWFALILATATTAVVVAVLQFVAGSNLLARMIAFIIVGTLLLAIASWFERLKTLR